MCHISQNKIMKTEKKAKKKRRKQRNEKNRKRTKIKVACLRIQATTD